jgi:polyadenylation factor subunit 2
MFYDDEDEQPVGPDVMRPPDTVYDGRRQRKPISRRWIDHHMAFSCYMQDRPFQLYDQFPQNLPNQFRTLYPPFVYRQSAIGLTSKIIRSATNKKKASVLAMAWQPNGRRLVAGYQNGLVTLWNGTGFQFDIILQRHKEAITDLVWSNSGDYMLSVDDSMLVKVWQANYDVIDEWKMHERKVRQLSFSPSDRKFASCSDDTTVKIWDLATQREERNLTDHGCEVRTVDWHPSRALIASAGKDGNVRLFDPRDGLCMTSMASHKNVCTKVTWNQNGYHLLSSGRDWAIRLVDTRMMSEIMKFQGHEKEVFTIAWHPTQEDIFVSGGFIGEMHWWAVGVERPLYSLPTAHKNGVYQLRYHPLGHILASTGQEGMVKFWVRNKAGDDVVRSSNNKTESLAVVPLQANSKNIPGLPQFHSVFPGEAAELETGRRAVQATQEAFSDDGEVEEDEAEEAAEEGTVGDKEEAPQHLDSEGGLEDGEEPVEE